MDTAPSRPRPFSILTRLLLVGLAALLVVGAAPHPAAAARVDANAELKVAREAYDVLLKELYKEPDTEAILNAAYAAAQKSLNTTGAPLTLGGSTTAQWNTFATAVRGLVQKANADLPEFALRGAMIDAMAESVADGHTAYLNRANYSRYRAESRGDLSIVNYGFLRMNAGDDVYMRSVVPGGNVERAGARAGDQILAFDGQKVTAANANDLFANPKEGSQHVFSVRSVGETQPHDLNVTVRKYDRTTVSSRVIDGHIGYLNINQFLAETPGKVDEALAGFAQQGGVDVLIVDVRGNPGGFATAESSIVGRFLPNGTVMGSNAGRNVPARNNVARSDGKTPNTLPLVVLMDDRSASAAEYLSLALRDFREATLVGIKTVGLLGAAQVFPLSDSTGLEVTRSVYTTARGEQLNGVGITPDVEIPNPTNDDVIAGRDPQLTQAIAQANVKVGRQATAPTLAFPETFARAA